MTSSKNTSRLEVLTKINETNEHITNKFHKLLSDLSWTQEDLQRNHQRSSHPQSKRRPQPKDREPSPDLRSSSQKLADYETAIRINPTKPDLMTQLLEDNIMATNPGQAGKEGEQSLTDILRQKRDLKRRRQKYRTTKAPPLSYTEEVRQLIGLQNEAWTQFLGQQRRTASPSARGKNRKHYERDDSDGGNS